MGFYITVDDKSGRSVNIVKNFFFFFCLYGVAKSLKCRNYVHFTTRKEELDFVYSQQKNSKAMTQRKNNCHVNENGIEILSCVCEWWNFRTDKHQIISVRQVLSQINSCYDITNISGIISTVNVILFM